MSKDKDNPDQESIAKILLIFTYRKFSTCFFTISVSERNSQRTSPFSCYHQQSRMFKMKGPSQNTTAANRYTSTDF